MSTRLNPPPELEDVTIRLDPSAEPAPETPQLHVKPRSRSVQDLYRLLGAGLAATDAICLSAALLFSHQIRYGTWFTHDYIVAQTLSVVLWIVVFKSFGLHSPERLSPPEEFRRVFNAASVGLMLMVMTTFWSHSGFSRMWVAMTYVLSVLFELAARQLWRKYLYRLRVGGALAFRTVIVGTNDEAGHLARLLAAEGSGFLPLGHVAPSDPLASPHGLPVLGHLDDLRTLSKRIPPIAYSLHPPRLTLPTCWPYRVWTPRARCSSVSGGSRREATFSSCTSSGRCSMEPSRLRMTPTLRFRSSSPRTTLAARVSVAFSGVRAWMSFLSSGTSSGVS